MKSIINHDWFSRIYGALIVVAVVKLLMVAAAFFLPKEGVDMAVYETDSIYARYRPSTMFALTKVQSEKVEEAPVYKLDNVALKGIFNGGKMPFIAVEDGKDVILIAKNELFKGYKLIEVHSYLAVFSKDGKRFELRFKDEGGAKDQGITVVKPEVIRAGERTLFVKRNEIQHYAKNFDAIWQNVKIEEVIKNKRLEGFEVTWVKQGSVFEKLGLQKGDIITGANDKKFKSLSQVFKLYNNMNQIDSIKLTILRDNQERELEYEIFE